MFNYLPGAWMRGHRFPCLIYRRPSPLQAGFAAHSSLPHEWGLRSRSSGVAFLLVRSPKRTSMLAHVCTILYNHSRVVHRAERYTVGGPESQWLSGLSFFLVRSVTPCAPVLSHPRHAPHPRSPRTAPGVHAPSRSTRLSSLGADPSQSRQTRPDSP